MNNGYIEGFLITQESSLSTTSAIVFSEEEAKQAVDLAKEMYKVTGLNVDKVFMTKVLVSVAFHPDSLITATHSEARA